MTSRPEVPQVISETKKLKAEFIESRLLHVYDFAAEVIGRVENHLDIGTYNGFALPRLATFASHVDSIDRDEAGLWRAEHRADVIPLIQQERVQLHHMDARNISLGINAYDSATIIEVFGAGFKGGKDDISKVFKGVYRSLKPGGTLVFTIKSKTTEDLLRTFGFGFNKGVSLSREKLTEILSPLFTPPAWYGQLLLRPYQGGLFIPGVIHVQNGDPQIRFNRDSDDNQLQWSADSLIPQQIQNPDIEKPMFWIGVCKKTATVT